MILFSDVFIFFNLLPCQGEVPEGRRGFQFLTENHPSYPLLGRRGGFL